MLTKILEAQAEWEQEHGRHCLAVYVSCDVIGAIHHAEDEAPGSMCDVAAGTWVVKGCDWYFDAALEPGAFRFE